MSETATSDGAVTHQASTDGIELLDGELVLLNQPPGWLIWWKQIALAVVLLVVGVVSSAIIEGIVLAGAIAGFVVLARSESRYIVTDQRVKGKIGLLSITTERCKISEIDSLTTDQSIFEGILGYGTIQMQTENSDKVVWPSVPEYQNVADTIHKQQQDDV